MRKTIGILLMTSVIFFSCKSQSPKEDEKDTNTTLNVNSSENNENNSLAINDKPVHITKKDFLEKVMNYEKNSSQWIYEGDLPCLIDFYADWCAPCRLTAPILEDLAKEYAGKIIIYKIDVQKEQELASVFRIQGIPAFLYCPLDGDPNMSSGIGNSLEDTKEMFRQNIENYLLKSKSSQM